MRFAFLRFFLSFLGVFVFVFVVVYISYVCHTCHNADCIKKRKIMGCKKTSSQFCVLVWYAMRGFEQTLYPVADTTPQSFRLVLQAEKPAPLTQGSRELRSDGAAHAFTLPRSATARYLSLSRTAPQILI